MHNTHSISPKENYFKKHLNTYMFVFVLAESTHNCSNYFVLSFPSLSNAYFASVGLLRYVEHL